MFQSLFYWITYSYIVKEIYLLQLFEISFNPYFIGLPILMTNVSGREIEIWNCFNPYFIGLPILIVTDLSALFQD